MNNFNHSTIIYWLFALLAFTNCAFAQILAVNQGSKISGPETMCAEGKGEYKFKHDVKNCLCDNITWVITGGVFDVPPITSAPLNEKVKIKWNKGVSNGGITMSARYCYKEIVDGSKQYELLLNRDESYTVHIYDPDMINMFVVGQSALSCNTQFITLRLISVNTHLNPNMLNNITWQVPPQWTIQPNQVINGLNHGASFPNIQIATNGQASGQNIVSVSYSFSTYCSTNSFNRSVTFNMDDCKQLISYTHPPTFHQSHSAESTHFSFDQPDELINGYNYTFVAGQELTLNPNFEVNAVEGTTFDAFIEACTCNSPWHDPNEKGETTVNFEGNFSLVGAEIESSDTESEVGFPTAEYNVSANESVIRIYPNPSGGVLMINTSNLFGVQTISLFNNLGRKVQEVLNDFEKNSNLELDLSTLPKGIYLLSIKNSSGNYSYHSKLVLQ